MESVEFYNTPEGDVMYKQLGKPVQELTADSREVIEEMLDLIKTRYPQTFRALCELYTASELNRKVYEFKLYLGSADVISANMMHILLISTQTVSFILRRSSARCVANAEWKVSSASLN